MRAQSRVAGDGRRREQAWRRDASPRRFREMPRPFEPSKEPHRDLSRFGDTFIDEAQDLATKRGYLTHVPAGARALDVGCGQGRFLDLLKARGIEALGIDASAEACSQCSARGHATLHGDAIVLLKRLHEERRRFSFLLLAHVIEHCDGDLAQDLIASCARVLEPQGRLLVATPNVRNLIVLEETFWLDPTHVRPYPRALLERMGKAEGLSVHASYDDRATTPKRSFARRMLAQLRSWWSGADRSGPMDSVVVFEKPRA